MTKLKVHAIFDNGTRRENQSYLLVPEGATIGEAVYSFNRHHAQELWKVQQVKLVGIVARKDRDNRKADIALAPMSVQLGDMLGPDDYLVLCSCDPPPPVPPPPGTSATLAVANDPPSSAAAEDEAPQPGEKVTEEDGMSGPNGKTRRGGRISNDVRSCPKRNEVRKLQDNLSFPTLHQKRVRKKRTPFDLQEDADSRCPTKSSIKRARKTRIQYNGPQSGVAYDYSKSSSEGVHHEKLEDPPPTKARTQPSLSGRHVNHSASQHYNVGSRHFYLKTDGVKHPVIVQKQPGAPGSKLKSNERRISFEGHPKTTRRVTTSQLLPALPDKEKTFEDAKDTTKEKTRDDIKQKRLKAEQQRNQKRAKGEEPRSTQRRQRNKNGAMCLEQERKQFGDRTIYWGPFPEGEKPGSLIVQDARRVYFAKDNETPYVIAKRFGVPVGKVVYDNCLNYHALRQKSLLKALTVIVLPLEATVSNVEDASLGRNEKLNCDKGVSSFRSKFTGCDNSIENHQDTVPVINDEDATLGRDEKRTNCDECASSFHVETTELDDHSENQRDALTVSSDGDITLGWAEKLDCDESVSVLTFHSETTESEDRMENQRDAMSIKNDEDTNLGHGKKLNCEEGVSSFHTKTTEFEDSIAIPRDAVPVNNDGDASLERNEKFNCNEGVASFNSETAKFDDSIDNQQAMPVNSEGVSSLGRVERLNYDEGASSFHSETTEFDNRMENQQDAMPINNE